MDIVENLTKDTLASALSKPGLVVVDFWAGWCPPCRAMAPQFERAAILRPQHRFAKVDVDAEPELAAAYGIASIPTIVVLRDGEPIAAQAGVVGTQQLLDALDRLAAQARPAAVAAGEGS
jgi:thioredoxin